jgi:YD repeat-containing protein
VALFEDDKLANWWLGISEANFYYSEMGLLDSIDNGIIGHQSYFEYADGKLIKMTKKIPTDITIEMIFEYDENGNWIGVQEYDDGALRFTLSYTYDEAGYLTSSTFTMGSTAETNYYCQCGDQNLRELNPINFFQHPIYYLSNGYNSYSFIGR